MRITYRPQVELTAHFLGISIEQAKEVKFNGISLPFIQFISEDEIIVAEEFKDEKKLIENAIKTYREVKSAGQKMCSR